MKPGKKEILIAIAIGIIVVISGILVFVLRDDSTQKKEENTVTEMDSDTQKENSKPLNQTQNTGQTNEKAEGAGVENEGIDQTKVPVGSISEGLKHGVGEESFLPSDGETESKAIRNEDEEKGSAESGDSAEVNEKKEKEDVVKADAENESTNSASESVEKGNAGSTNSSSGNTEKDNTGSGDSSEDEGDTGDNTEENNSENENSDGGDQNPDGDEEELWGPVF